MKVGTISRSSSSDRTEVIEIGIKSTGVVRCSTSGMGKMIEVFPLCWKVGLQN